MNNAQSASPHTNVSFLLSVQHAYILCSVKVCSVNLEKGFKKAENSEQNVVLLLFLFTLDIL